MVMYGDELNQREKSFKPRIKLNNNMYAPGKKRCSAEGGPTWAKFRYS